MEIYKTTNLINRRSYIGQDTKNNPNYLGSGVYLNKAIKKYGKENFQKEICAVLYNPDSKHLNYLEKLYIQFYKTKAPNGYNLTDGGDGLVNPSEDTRKKMSEKKKGMHLSEKTRGKISKALMGHITSEETKKKISKPQLGKSPWNKGKHGVQIYTEEIKKKISDSVKITMNKLEVRKRLRDSHLGKSNGPHSEETKEKIRQSHKGKQFSEEHRKHLSNSHKGKMTGKNNSFFGKHHSEETKRKIKERKTNGVRY